MNGTLQLLGGYDTVDFTLRDGHFLIECSAPWEGDSETGFGRELTLYCAREDAKILHRWLTEMLS